MILKRLSRSFSTHFAKPTNKPLFIAIEGNIGAGKTTLATKLAAKTKAKLFHEPVTANPYLEDFYKG